MTALPSVVNPESWNPWPQWSNLEWKARENREISMRYFVNNVPSAPELGHHQREFGLKSTKLVKFGVSALIEIGRCQSAWNAAVFEVSIVRSEEHFRDTEFDHFVPQMRQVRRVRPEGTVLILYLYNWKSSFKSISSNRRISSFHLKCNDWPVPACELEVCDSPNYLVVILVRSVQIASIGRSDLHVGITQQPTSKRPSNLG